MTSLYHPAKSWLRGVTFFSFCFSAAISLCDDLSVSSIGPVCGYYRSGSMPTVSFDKIGLLHHLSLLGETRVRVPGVTAEKGVPSMRLNHKANASLSIVIVMLSVMLAIPCLAADNNTRVIEVNGTGEARSTPDIAYLSLQVETHAATAEETSSKNAALAQKVVQELKNKLAGKGTVITGDYSLNPEYGENNLPRQKPVITGYTAQNTITVEAT